MYYALPGVTGRTDHPLSTPDPANLKGKKVGQNKDIWFERHQNPEI